MAFKSNIAQFAFTKALIVVALAAWLVASGAAAESRPEDGRRSFQALSAAHTPVLIKRMLRSRAVMTVADHTSTSEERVTFSDIGMSLDQILAKIKEFFFKKKFSTKKRLKSSGTIKPKMLKTKPENLESGTIKPENLESDAIKAESGTTKFEIIEENPEITESGLENPANFDSVKEIIERGSIKPKDFGEQALAYWFEFLNRMEKRSYKIDITPYIFRSMKTLFENDILIAYVIYTTMKIIKFEDTTELMMNLRNALFEKWLQEGKYPREINAMLKAAKKSDSDLEREIFDQIASQYDKFYGKVKVTMEDPGTSEEVKLDLSS